jgi:hypothetical protein
MKITRIIVLSLGIFVAILGAFFAFSAVSSANSNEDTYSIYILAGQSQAEGTNTDRNRLTGNSEDLYKYSHPADAATKFWWAGADGKGPESLPDYLNLVFYNENGFAGWVQSGGVAAGDNPALRIKTLGQGQTRNAQLVSDSLQFVGPEYGMARSLYEKGRRNIVILKVSYGFQSLAQSSSPAVPYDWSIHSTNKSYDRLKSEFAKLTSYIKNDLNAKYTVDGIFWNQGGTDTIQASYANAYEDNLRELVNAMRTDFQLHPDAHVVTAKINYQWCVDWSYPTTGNYCGLPWGRSLEPNVEFVFEEILSGAAGEIHPDYMKRHKTVRDAIQAIADEYDWVDTLEKADQKRGPDNLHYNEVGQITIGKRFSNMYRMPYRVDTNPVIVNGQTRTPTDYDGDGILNSQEDTGNRGCTSSGDGGVKANNGNLGDDDCDNDGYPNYLDRVNGTGSGL